MVSGPVHMTLQDREEGAAMDISVDRTSPIPLYLQIRQQVRSQIVSGALPAGFRLPPERRLAAALGVNRSTVLAAYRELRADALVDAHVGRGTVVLAAALPGCGSGGREPAVAPALPRTAPPVPRTRWSATSSS